MWLIFSYSMNFISITKTYTCTISAYSMIENVSGILNVTDTLRQYLLNYTHTVQYVFSASPHHYELAIVIGRILY